MSLLNDALVEKWMKVFRAENIVSVKPVIGRGHDPGIIS